MSNFFASQIFVEISVAIILILSLGLTLIMSKRYFKSKSKPLLFWSSGMWFFTFGVLLELLFSFNYYFRSIGDLYLLSVSLIVELLAMGSVQLYNSKKLTNYYAGFMVLSTIILIYSLISSNMGNILDHYIVYSVLPLSVVLASSLVTFPAAILLILIAAISYKKKRNYKMLSIIIGVIIVAMAGTLYIVEIPVFLYYSEFIGILLLWYGFI